MRRVNCRRSTLWALAAVLSSMPQVRGEVLTFDLPELLGTYQNASRQISLDLGVSFARMDAVSLHLAGTHQVGSYSDLNFPGSFPYPAEMYGSLSELAFPYSAGFDQYLPTVSGPFDITYAFRGFYSLQPNPDFSPLLDGEAEFSFAAFGGALIATTYVTAYPWVTIDTATLMISGELEGAVHFTPGDYDGDGIIDDADYEVWRSTIGSVDDLRADGNGDSIVDAADFSVWRDNLGTRTDGPTSTESVPEPYSLVLMISAFAPIVVIRRRGRAAIAAAGRPRCGKKGSLPPVSPSPN